MKSDYRLNFAGVYMDKYREQHKQELENAWQIVLQDNVGNICDRLVCELLHRIDDDIFPRCSYPDMSTLNPKVQEALSQLYRSIVEQEGVANPSGPIVVAIGEVIAEKLANKTKENFSIWAAISERIQEQFELYSCWIRYIPVTTIKNHLPEIVKGPEAEHPLALVETWGLYRDKSKWPGYDAYLEEKQEQAIDRWDYISKVIAMTEEWWPGMALRFHSDLLQRAGWDCWLQWLAGLDIPLQYLLLREIGDLDVYEQLMIWCCSDTSLNVQDRLDLLILTMMGCLQLWEKISNNLRHWADDRIVISEEEEKYRQNAENELNNWVNGQMYERAQRVVKIMDLDSAQGEEIACLMLSNLQVGDVIRDLPSKLLRQAVVEELKMMPDTAKSVTEKFIHSPIRGKKKLLSVWGMLSNTKEESMSVNYEITLWKYYIDWLQSLSFNWYSTNIPGTDDATLIQAMAELLAEMEDPVVCWRKAYDEVYYPPEGWGWQFRKYNDSLERIAHLLTVGFLAPGDLLNSGRHDQGTKLFQLVWDKTIYGIRNSYEFPWLSVQVPLSLGWSNLSYVFPETYSEIALQAMEKIDDVELLIYCATRLWSSVEGYPDLVSSFGPLKDYIKLRFDKGFPLLQAKYGERDERIESYITLLDGLGCTQGRK